MLNVESRKYFNRAFSSSGSALRYTALRKGNHIKQIKMCAKVNGTDPEKYFEYLKTTSNLILANCYAIGYGVWLPTIESANTKGAFLTKAPEEIYNSDLAPATDAMFGITSHVHIELLNPRSVYFIRCCYFF